MINIVGVIFNIDDNANDFLKDYNNALRAHFINSPDGLEIVSDIESRIAELFSEILKQNNSNVITKNDVESVINRLGNVSDFSFEQKEEEKEEKKNENKNDKDKDKDKEAKPKRLTRKSESTVAGVCAGIADYFDVDSTWIKLLWAGTGLITLFSLCIKPGIITILFHITFVLVYIILWIIMPWDGLKKMSTTKKIIIIILFLLYLYLILSFFHFTISVAEPTSTIIEL